MVHIDRQAKSLRGEKIVAIVRALGYGSNDWVLNATLEPQLPLTSDLDKKCALSRSVSAEAPILSEAQYFDTT